MAAILDYGFTQFGADGYPLGFGKITGNMLKNGYLPGWRYQ